MKQTNADNKIETNMDSWKGIPHIAENKAYGLRKTSFRKQFMKDKSSESTEWQNKQLPSAITS